MRSDPDKSRLGFEFAAHAMRSEPFREELLTRFATLRGRMEAIFRRRMEELGLEPVVGLDRMVLMIIAMAEGWKIWQMLDPDVGRRRHARGDDGDLRDRLRRDVRRARGAAGRWRVDTGAPG